MNFEFGTSSRIIFGWGGFARLPELAAEMGKRALIVTGGRSFRESGALHRTITALEQAGLVCADAAVAGEPTVERVDEIVAQARAFEADLVIAIGGGSAIDAAKAAAAVVTNAPPGTSAREFLEGVGTGRKVARHPLRMIAVPTTSGTGAEVTKNAVLRDSARTFKKSMRHPLMRPEVALVDPELTLTAPRGVKAASGMDAITQLIEGYLSVNSSPFTSSLAIDALDSIAVCLDDTLLGANGLSPEMSHTRMAYASLNSGIILDNAGLGAVHGLASPLGAFFDVPHGVVCANLLPEITAANISELQAQGDEAGEFNVDCYRAAVASTFGLDPDEAAASPGDVAWITDRLAQLRTDLKIPRLATYGIRRSDIPRIVANCRGGSMRTNPVVLSDEELTAVLKRVIDTE